MKKVLILCLLLSACSSNCYRIDRGLRRCDYPDFYCLNSTQYVPGIGIMPAGMQCFEKKEATTTQK